MIVNNPIYNKVDTSSLAKEATLNQVKSDIATIHGPQNTTIGNTLYKTVLNTEVVQSSDTNVTYTVMGSAFLSPGIYKVNFSLKLIGGSGTATETVGIYVPACDADNLNTPATFDSFPGPGTILRSGAAFMKTRSPNIGAADLSSVYSIHSCFLLVPSQALVFFMFNQSPTYFIGACNLIEIYI